MTFSMRALTFYFCQSLLGHELANYAVKYLLFLSQAPLTGDLGSANITETGISRKKDRTTQAFGSFRI
jgi:hypothetical protein